MKKSPMHIHHTFTVTFDQEQRLAKAIIIKYGRIQGWVNTAIVNAIMKWVEEVEYQQEKEGKKQNK